MGMAATMAGSFSDKQLLVPGRAAPPHQHHATDSVGEQAQLRRPVCAWLPLSWQLQTKGTSSQVVQHHHIATMIETMPTSDTGCG